MHASRRAGDDAGRQLADQISSPVRMRSRNFSFCKSVPCARMVAAASVRMPTFRHRAPAASALPLVISRVHWVRPELVAEVKYLTWTDNLLRQVVYEGLRVETGGRRPVPH
jgi:hypothetical protein